MNTTHTKHKTVKYKYTVNKTRAGIQITHGIHTTNLGFVWQFIYLLLLRAYTNKTYKAYITYTNVKNYNPKSEYKQNTIKIQQNTTDIKILHNTKHTHIYIYCLYIYIYTNKIQHKQHHTIYIYTQTNHAYKYVQNIYQNK